MPKLYFLSKAQSAMSELFSLEARTLDIEFHGIYTDYGADLITLVENQIIINGDLIEKNDAIIAHGIKPEFISIPDDHQPVNRDYLNDSQLKKEQQHSFVMSLCEYAKNIGIKAVNSPMSLFNNYNKYYNLQTIGKSGATIPQIFLSNSYKDFLDSGLDSELYFWSYVDSDSPVKVIHKNKIAELFAGNELPKIIMPYIEGNLIKMWYFGDSVIAGAIYSKPNFDFTDEKPEYFKFIAENEAMKNFGDLLYKALKIDFCEVTGIVTEQGEMYVLNIAPDSEISALPEGAGEYIAHNILCKLFDKESQRDNISEISGYKSSVFLSRMLDPLFEFEIKAVGK